MIHYKLTMQEVIHSLEAEIQLVAEYRGWNLDFECIQNENKQVIKKGFTP